MKVTIEIVGLMKPSGMCIFHLSPSVFGNTFQVTSVTAIKGFPLTYGFFLNPILQLEKPVKKLKNAELCAVSEFGSAV